MDDGRPIECSCCKRKASIIFKEIADGKCCSTRVCSQCPYLQSKIGLPIEESSTSLQSNTCCKNCNMSHHTLTMGHPIGCEHCYETFSEFLVDDMMQENRLPSEPKISLAREKHLSLHLGNIQEKLHIDLTTKLETLNSALKEALHIENYERAASLRDEIKNLIQGLNG